MLLSREPYRWVEPKLYEKKLSAYAKEIKKGGTKRLLDAHHSRYQAMKGI
jgi:hypothetical protein